MLEQFLGLIGAALILCGYALMMFKPCFTRYAYIISLCGGILLLWLAVIYHNIGLMVLECAWIVINLWGLMHPRIEQ